MTYYDLLGVPRTASLDEIKRAYREQIKFFHPDVFDGPPEVAREKTIQLNEAYETLKDSKRRAAYDRLLDFKAQHDGSASAAHEAPNNEPPPEQPSSPPKTDHTDTPHQPASNSSQIIGVSRSWRYACIILALICFVLYRNNSSHLKEISLLEIRISNLSSEYEQQLENAENADLFADALYEDNVDLCNQLDALQAKMDLLVESASHPQPIPTPPSTVSTYPSAPWLPDFGAYSTLSPSYLNNDGQSILYSYSVPDYSLISGYFAYLESDGFSIDLEMIKKVKELDSTNAPVSYTRGDHTATFDISSVNGEFYVFFIP